VFIVLIGPPGSGKGTQSESLAKELNLPYISVGNIFRKMVEAKNEEGLLINEYMSQGKLAPASLVNKTVEKFLLLEEYKNGCVLDGYPRNLEQALFFNNFANKIEKEKNIKVIYFAVDDQIIINRLQCRFNCANCGAIYNKHYIKPKVENVCDVCGSNNFSFRQDDDTQTIKRRIEEYNVETLPVINYYKQQGELYTIDAGQNKDIVESDLRNIRLKYLEN